MQLVCKALKVMWVEKLLNEEHRQWKAIPLYYLEKAGGKIIFECNYDLKLLDIELPPINNSIFKNNPDRIKTNNTKK